MAATLAISSLPLTGLDISSISLSAVSTAVLFFQAEDGIRDGEL